MEERSFSLQTQVSTTERDQQVLKARCATRSQPRCASGLGVWMYYYFPRSVLLLTQELIHLAENYQIYNAVVTRDMFLFHFVFL